MADKILMVDQPSVTDPWRAIENANSTIEDLKDSEFRRIERQIQQGEAGPIDAFVTDTAFYCGRLKLSKSILHSSKLIR
jgi:hypothetical protein